MENKANPVTNPSISTNQHHNLELELASINATPNNENKLITEDYCVDLASGTSNYSKNFENINNSNENVSNESIDSANVDIISLRSFESFICRICHNNENPDRLISPCLCKGSLSYVHTYCLERWIGTSQCTACELCQFEYSTEQSLRYTCLESLRLWYSRSMSRRILREDCQMFSLLTVVSFGIIGTLLVAVQYYFLQSSVTGLNRLWTKGWLIFILCTTLVVYLLNVYMIAKSQLEPWYRWWQSERDVRLILENQRPFTCQINSIQLQPESV